MGAPTMHVALPRSPWVDGSAWLPEGLTGTLRVRHAPGGLVVAHGVLTVTGSGGIRASAVPAEFRPAGDVVAVQLVRYGSTQVLGQLGINGAGTIALFGGTANASPARFFTTWST